MGALEIAMSKSEAESVTMTIRYTLKAVENSLGKAMDLLEKAEAGRAWEVLGYPSLIAYVESEFGDAFHGINREARRPIAVKLRGSGASTRAIGEVVGVNASTVSRDLSGVADATPAEVTGKDGKTYRPARVLPSGKVDAATVEAMGNVVPPVKRRKPPTRRRKPTTFVGDPTLIAGIRKDLDTLSDRVSRMDDDGVQEFRRTYADELAAIVRIARGMVDG